MRQLATGLANPADAAVITSYADWLKAHPDAAELDDFCGRLTHWTRTQSH
jgi:hypothetical protein